MTHCIANFESLELSITEEFLQLETICLFVIFIIDLLTTSLLHQRFNLVSVLIITLKFI